MDEKENKRNVLGIRLDDTELEELRKISEKNDRLMSQQVRWFIKQGIRSEENPAERNPDGSVKQ